MLRRTKHSLLLQTRPSSMQTLYCSNISAPKRFAVARSAFYSAKLISDTIRALPRLCSPTVSINIRRELLLRSAYYEHPVRSTIGKLWDLKKHETRVFLLMLVASSIVKPQIAATLATDPRRYRSSPPVSFMSPVHFPVTSAPGPRGFTHFCLPG